MRRGIFVGENGLAARCQEGDEHGAAADMGNKLCNQVYPGTLTPKYRQAQPGAICNIKLPVIKS